MVTTQPRKILIVDDEPLIREILRFALQFEGHEVLEAESGHRAFELLQSQAVDLVLSDIRMPNGDGIELLANIRAQDAVTPPVVFMTGFSDLSRENAISKGASELIYKPFELDQLLKIITSFLK
ncbi:MAG: response regulator [Methylotenera sp.]|nr:response regulator [Oligoflexia bacterium]